MPFGPSNAPETQPKDLATKNVFSWEEVAQHSKPGDAWIVVDRGVYNISQWALRHPGGKRVILSYSGEDATEPFRAFHPDPDFVQKYLKALKIGELSPDAKVDPIAADFRELRKEVEASGLLRPNLWFFAGMLLHIMAIDALAWCLLYYFGNTWLTWLAAAALLTTAQNQAGWLQHDLGHLSVFFRNSRWNHVLHHFVIGIIKGTSATWWNFRHFQHHAKPNIIAKDPDIAYPWVFMFGKYAPELWGKRKKRLYALSVSAFLLVLVWASGCDPHLFPH